jgi:integrase
MEEKFDPHNNKEKYFKWRHEKGAPLKGVSEKNRQIIIEYLDDMELGANVSIMARKGPRSYIRLVNLKSKMYSWAIIFQEELNIDFLPDLVNKEREFLQVIKKLRDGQIKTRSRRGVFFTGAGTMIKALKAFWHWYQKVQRKKGIVILDIVQDIDGQDPKPKFNYITIEQVNQLCNEANYDYRVLMMFLFDTGIRAPTELMNVKVSDLEWNQEKNIYTLTIRPETSKTFGRRIKLMLCSPILKEYVKNKKLKPNEFIFTKYPHSMNQYLKLLASKILGIGEFSKKRDTEGHLYTCCKDGLTMYDFRHSSACYWLPRYKSESALKYRFGWMKSSMIHYYTELLGMSDTIQEEDLYVDVSKTQLENEIAKKGNEINLLQEQIQAQNDKMSEMMQIIKAIQMDKSVELITIKTVNNRYSDTSY